MKGKTMPRIYQVHPVLWVPLALVLLVCGPARAQQQAAHEVTGHGSLTFTAGDGTEPYLDQVSINAWQNSDDPPWVGHGNITWISNYNATLPPGRANDGYPYIVDVDMLVMVAPKVAFVARTIYSPQVPADTGFRTGFLVTDNGTGAAAPPDEIFRGWGIIVTGDGDPYPWWYNHSYGGPVHSGNFTIR
jgi:hypothetical protein